MFVLSPNEIMSMCFIEVMSKTNRGVVKWQILIHVPLQYEIINH